MMMMMNLMMLREYVAERHQIFVKWFHIIDIVTFSETFLSLRFRDLDSILIVLGDSRVEKIGAHEQGCAAHARVTVDQNFAFFMSDNEVYDLGRIENLLKRGIGKIFPIEVEEGDVIVH